MNKENELNILDSEKKIASSFEESLIKYNNDKDDANFMILGKYIIHLKHLSVFADSQKQRNPALSKDIDKQMTKLLEIIALLEQITNFKYMSKKTYEDMKEKIEEYKNHCDILKEKF